MRYIIYGAGAVGGVIGARMFQGGNEVILIARGQHFDALHRNGLEFVAPEGSHILGIPTVDTPEKIEFREDDVVILTMKSQDTLAAVETLRISAPPKTPIVCAQNGVENERVTARRFENVYGICVMLPAAHLEPGVVRLYAAPLSGILDIGRYPDGIDSTAERIAKNLEASHFSSLPDLEIMRQKYAKLIMNLGNVLDAACGREARGSDIHRRAIDEAMTCFAAAGIDVASRDEVRERRGDVIRIVPDKKGESRSGGSTWQSLARMTGTVETDYLNGEIVMLGRIHGIPTPVNAMLNEIGNVMARKKMPPGSMALAELTALL